MSRRLVLRLALIATIALASLFAGASSAFAHTYCVGVVDVSCTGPARDTTEAGINAAFADVGADADGHSTVLIGSILPIVINNGLTLTAGHPVDIVGRAVSGIDAKLQMTGLGSLLSFNSSATGNTHGTISGIKFAVTATAGALRAVRVNNVDVRDCTFDLTRNGASPVGLVAQGPTGSHHLAFSLHNGIGAAAFIDAADAEINDSTITGDGNYSEGFIQTDPSTHTYRRNHFFEITDPIESLLGTAIVQDSLIDLGTLMNATAASASSSSSTDGLVAVKLDGSTVVGTGDGQLALYSSSYDVAKPVDASADSTIVDLKGANTQVGFCSTTTGGIANLETTYSLIPLAADKFDLTSCTNTLDTSTDIDIAAHAPLYVGAGDYRPAAGSPVINAGNPDAIRPLDSKDLSGNSRIFSESGTPRIDIGAYEKGPTPPAPPTPGGGTTTPEPPDTLSFTKPKCKFRSSKKAKNGFTVHAAKIKDCYLQSVSSRAHSYMFRLERTAAGYVVGGACKAKQGKSGKANNGKRCNLPLKGSQTIDLPAGTSYLSFGARWNNKSLPPGTYTLRSGINGINPNGMPNRISMNLTVARQGSSGRTK